MNQKQRLFAKLLVIVLVCFIICSSVVNFSFKQFLTRLSNDSPVKEMLLPSETVESDPTHHHVYTRPWRADSPFEEEREIGSVMNPDDMPPPKDDTESNSSNSHTNEDDTRNQETNLRTIVRPPPKDGTESKSSHSLTSEDHEWNEEPNLKTIVRPPRKDDTESNSSSSSHTIKDHTGNQEPNLRIIARPPSDTPPPPPPKNKFVKVMHWNIDEMPRNEKTFNFVRCPPGANQCVQTYNETEAQIFTINPARPGRRLPKRKPGDVWVMKTRETPFLGRFPSFLQSKEIEDQFNWTMSILQDSTFQVVYGTVYPIEPPIKDYHAVFRQKKYEVAWFVSHCKIPSRRQEYVERMISSVPVHIYGKCGTRSCGGGGYDMGGERDECMEMLGKEYKFYLSFENSFCRDYLTEKIFQMYKVDVIPVVRGGANYSHYLPDGTYVNSADFSSPEQLGTYLHELANDEKRYTDMLRRKNGFAVRPGAPVDNHCEMCRKFHSNPQPQWYHNPWKFIDPERNCWPPADLG